MSPTIKSISGLLDVAATRFPTHRALVSPLSCNLTYQELLERTRSLAAWLQLYGYESNDVIVSDLGNTPENLITQLACNRLGIYYATAKDLDAMAKFPKVKGAICTDGAGFLADTSLPLPYLSGEFVHDLILEGGLKDFSNNIADLDDALDESESDDHHNVHAYYNSATNPFTNQQAIDLGQDAVSQLNIQQEDIMCISITLCHAFGMGTAISSALLSGATMALPQVGGGISGGCGVPSERAAATLELLHEQKCTLLMADTHTLKALPNNEQDDASLITHHLRGGIVKIGSGSDFLSETRSFQGVKLMTMGKNS